jgi:hypothetical protein
MPVHEQIPEPRNLLGMSRTALKYANRALVLEMGRLALDRPAPELLHDPNLNRLFLGGHVPHAEKSGA